MLVTVNDQPLYHADSIAAGVSQIKDICDEAVPGYLPTRAIYELLTDIGVDSTSTRLRTSCEFKKMDSAIPLVWNKKIATECAPQSPVLQLRFGFLASWTQIQRIPMATFRRACV